MDEIETKSFMETIYEIGLYTADHLDGQIFFFNLSVEIFISVLY